MQQYVKGEMLGEGAYGMVFSVKDQEGKTWALKTLTKPYFDLISHWFKECSFNLLFDTKCPLMNMQDVFLEFKKDEYNDDQFFMHILME